MGERPVVLNVAHLLLSIVLVAAVFFTVIGTASIVWGMATGNHFQAYSVPVEWSAESLVPPDTTDSDVAVRGVGLPVEGSVSVDFGRGWSSWLVLEALIGLVRGGAIAAGSWVLLRLVRDVKRGVRLHDRHGRSVAMVGGLALGAPVLVGLFTLVQPNLVEGGSVASSAASVEFPLLVWAAGLVLIVLGSVLRYAAEVESEHSLTV